MAQCKLQKFGLPSFKYRQPRKFRDTSRQGKLGWFGDSERHSLSARGIKSSGRMSELYKKSYADWLKKNPKASKVYATQSEVFKTLGDKYRSDLKKQKWFTGSLYSIAVSAIPSSEYDKLNEERRLESHGEMSYAMTVLHPDNSRERIVIRDSGSERLNKKLLKHELEEYKIYRKLLDDGITEKEAQPLAHELTFTKVNNKEVDTAYGNIGDPL
jgi:hypothetical protein